MSLQAQIAIRTRKLGVLIRDARLAARRSITETAQAIGITAPLLRAYEEGRKAPSLPELEVLAYYLNLPIQHFWSNQALSDDAPRTEPLDLTRLASLRHRIIGTLLRQKRMQANLSLKGLAAETGLPVSRLTAYELGERPIPLPELEAILSVLGGRIESFFDQKGVIGQWMNEQETISAFMKLPPEMRAFVCMPVNQPYLELARKLSQLSTEKLRAVAEGLLDITL
ncbi:MAG: helix-turn-helix domain-containing protein [Anaerolineales bacterium]|nr:helix-turn-helix domain-containing protein [Anaerolineales bacterium]MCX7755755.1 helix-turn-helix domain-containing protein [Anaerolineales bacterium]MDW8277645.1 helix-turn-helix transcriptional regulator [Anaerolineales bacterium]